MQWQLRQNQQLGEVVKSQPDSGDYFRHSLSVNPINLLVSVSIFNVSK